MRSTRSCSARRDSRRHFPQDRLARQLQKTAALAHARDADEGRPEVASSLVVLAVAVLADDAHLATETEEVHGSLVGDRKSTGPAPHACHAVPSIDIEVDTVPATVCVCVRVSTS